VPGVFTDLGQDLPTPPAFLAISGKRLDGDARNFFEAEAIFRPVRDIQFGARRD
jgi:hypothetical protein